MIYELLQENKKKNNTNQKNSEKKHTILGLEWMNDPPTLLGKNKYGTFGTRFEKKTIIMSGWLLVVHTIAANKFHLYSKYPNKNKNNKNYSL